MSDKELLLASLDAAGPDLVARYIEALHSDDATIEDLRKAVDMQLKRYGVGQEKADTRVVVDIVFENGAITSATPPTLELKPEVSDAVIKQVANSVTPADFIPEPEHPAQPTTSDDFSALLDELIPVQH